MASEYGWAKDDILDRTYLDELYYLIQEIKKRKFNEYRIQLRIAENPHTKNPEELWNILNAQNEREPDKSALDRAGFSVLKSRLSGNRKFQIK